MILDMRPRVQLHGLLRHLHGPQRASNEGDLGRGTRAAEARRPHPPRRRRRRERGRAGSSATTSTRCSTSSHRRRGTTTGSRISGATCPRCLSRPRPLRRSLFRQQTSSGVATTLAVCSRRIRRATSPRWRLRLAATKLGIDVYRPSARGAVTTYSRRWRELESRPMQVGAPPGRRSLSFGATQQGETGTVCCDESTSEARLMHMPPIARRSTAASSCLTEEFAGRTQVHLRLSGTNNNQKFGVKLGRRF